MRPLWRTAVPVVTVAAGLLFGISASVADGDDIRPENRGRAEALRDLEQAVAGKEEEVLALRAEVDSAVEQEVGSPGSDDPLVRAAGLSEVSGPGLEVVLDDSPLRGDEVPEGFGANDLVIHQEQLQAVVNAMWAGGAEAVQLMDQRLVSTSAVRCVGNTLILQGRVYSPPFVVRAIGPADDMRAQLDASLEVQLMREYTSLLQLGYTEDPVDSMTVPAFRGELQLAATPAATDA
ncbi:DUF881 domain-containing protein [Kytococcus sedentarius]|uniref:Uncharacterized conserved protein n=1 Tax=Kytococcus sedentarius (strain ATCC 14392 / DSM 20547 / JCM 11482 / CCUG 33030 / NBRC 15357 / NCTC 11040 / CCM 314 / 541) TaxID=478801 RepID=C7NIE4_KYTSD|nr:DUF881 domain-containing protein [Kytococcus sedentarius]ACV05115.1 uncharacterized conserved protein [Kytococcus sedentarius DSM 20547]QQB63589.1 DUF881 domain-containing protein [Kytococcus sedentarius]STX13481.1 Bacterial protein of uncharacterised function (DUF881) [Kytococcus sedentarius]